MKVIKPNGACYTFHFMIHGIHHAFPQDELRLVFPPVASYIIYVFGFWIPFKFLIPIHFRYGYLIGIVIGYEMYDVLHYAFHHSNPAEGSYMKEMKTYHMQHHYKEGLIGFGVS
tara:strand:- start:221 stop:562 length:342 start_codon:yes stop_codon:yes gene_type:complete